MPRIRTVKPDYPQHRKTRAVTRDARLLNVHLWNLADDEGRLQELVPWIIGEVFPGDEDVTPVVLREWLGELQGAGLIVRYEVDGERYIQCHDFNDHQVINKPKPSALPAPPAGSTDPPDQSGSTTGDIPDDYRPEGNGKEGERKGDDDARATDPPDQSGTDPVAVPEHLTEIIAALDRVSFARNLPSPKVAAAIGACEDFADRDLEQEAAKFTHYWLDGPGEKRDLSDVAWAWRNWLERAEPKGARATTAAAARASVGEDLKRLAEEHEAAVAEEQAAEVKA